MALFSGNKETAEEKQERKTQELMEKFGIEDLQDEHDKQTAWKIAGALAGNGWMEAGALLKGNGTDAAKLSYLRAIVHQNWIIIRQLDRLNKNLEK